MANGLCPYLLQDMRSIAGAATPQYKVDMHGLLNMLYTVGNPDAITITSPPGHRKTVDVKYRQRFTKAQTATSASCDHVLIPAYKEGTVTVDSFRQIAVHLDDELVATYCADASQRQNVPGATPGTSVTAEMLDIMLSAANALLYGVNSDLMGLITYGNNRNNSNSNAALTINFPQTVTTQPLNNGINRILTDYRVNNLTGRPQAIGLGFAHAWTVSQPYKGLDQGGIDTRIANAMWDFWPDQDYAAAKGANEFMVVEPGSMQFVQYKRYTGFKAGTFGTSTFGMLPMPMYDPLSNMMRPVMFDYQFKYSDCPETLTDYYTNQSVAVEKGWNMIISITFGLWQVYMDAYRNDDLAAGANGCLRYTATNS